MTINYTYEIAAVDEQARCMEVIYRAEGHPEQRVGARLPYEGEALEGVISMYAPVAYWESLRATVIVPEVGLVGTMTPLPLSPEPLLTPDQIEAAKNAEMWEQVHFERRVAKALVKFGVLQSDPTNIEVTLL
jgi:hypothetical protein